ncbi:MAG: amidohydrolase [Trueperaceae bacterium]|nr:amidohydrolase [Trueperaceae bacterium]
MLERAQELYPALSHLRRTIHQNPELSFSEHKTAALVSETLTNLGVKHQKGIGKTGVVATLGNGNGPKIGIRADMDALPINELTGKPYASQNPGKMHACGHDSHTTMLMGVAMLLSEESFDGEIRLLFQPSEEAQDDEGHSGATRMIDDKAIEGLDAVIALHVDPSLESGKVGIKDGFTLANVDSIAAKIKGKGGHGASPHLARDPIFMAAPILTALHGIVSRWVKPTEPAVVTVGRLVGGTVSNVIPNDVELDLTLRSASDEVRALLLKEVEQALSIAKALGGDYEMNITRGYPALYNDPKVANWIRETAKDLIGPDNVVTGEMVMGGEDFSYMTRASQGAMMRLGTWEKGTPQRFLHHPEFDMDEGAMPIGAAIMAETALRFVRGQLE